MIEIYGVAVGSETLYEFSHFTGSVTVAVSSAK